MLKIKTKSFFNWFSNLIELTNKNHRREIYILLFAISIAGILDLFLILNLTSLINQLLGNKLVYQNYFDFISLPFLVLLLALSNGLLRNYTYRKNSTLAADIAAYVGANIAKDYLLRKDIRDSRVSRSRVVSTLSIHTTYLAQSIIMPLINFISNLILLIIILIGLFFEIGPVVLVYVSGILLTYIIITKTTSARLKSITESNNFNQKKLSQYSDEIVSGERDLRTYSLVEYTIKDYYKNDLKLKKNQGFALFLQMLPRISIEAALYSAIAIIALFQEYYSEDPNLKNSNLSLIILIAITKLLPYFQAVYANCIGVISFYKTVDLITYLKNISSNLLSNNRYTEIDAEENLFFAELPNLKRKRILSIRDLTKDLDKRINLRSKNKTLKIGNLNIFEGEKWVIYGESGSGKSTLLDIIMGFTGFNEGTCKIHIDHEDVALVSQNTFITDGPLGENITQLRDENKWNKKRLNQSLEEACLNEYLNQSRLNISKETISGGQAKRIGLAKAIYSGRKVLLLDEVDSGLDKKTIKVIFDKLLSNKDTTVICVTHNLSLVDKFQNKINLSI